MYSWRINNKGNSKNVIVVVCSMQNPSKYRIKWFRLLTIVLGVCFLYSFIQQQNQLNAIRRDSDSVRAQLTEFRESNTNLKEERDALNDRRYVEKLAREELGLVKPGEIPYIVSEKK